MTGLKVACDGCLTDMEESGGLLFGPPVNTPERIGYCMKLHLCRTCYEYVFEYIMRLRQENKKMGGSSTVNEKQ